MKILALDTSTMMASCAVMDDTRVLGEYSLSQEMSHSEKLVPMIDEMLAGLNLNISDIDLYGVAIGPGSFTGLRIGVATVKAFAHMFDKPIIGVSTLEGLAFNLPYNKIVVPMIDARRNRVYTGIYSWKDGKLNTIMKPDALEIDDLLKTLHKNYENVVVTGDGVNLHFDKIKEMLMEGVQYATIGLNHCKASSIAELALNKYNDGKRDNYYTIIPDYLRKSQAERELEKKGAIDMDIIVRKMEERDLDKIMEVEKSCFTTPWSRNSFIFEITGNQLARYFVAEVDGIVAGYGGIWLILDEGHITNIAVDEEYRRLGVGKKILEALIDLCEKYEIIGMTLEVREDNEPAKMLYKNYEFIENGIRPNYYQDVGKDAILMWKKLESRE